MDPRPANRRDSPAGRALACAAAAALWFAGCGGAGPEDTDSAMDGGMAGMGGMAHGDHQPRYGGYVFMHGDLHFEVVLTPEGEHRIYFSDAVRSELPAAVADDVRITLRRGEGEDAVLEPLRPEIDEFGEAWIARSEPVAAEDDAFAILYFRFEGAPYEIEVPFVMEPPDPAVDPHRRMQ